MTESPSPEKPKGKRRIGRFQISHVTFAHDWHAVLPLMAKVAILRAESLYHLDAIEYLALCDEFEEIEVTIIPPLYCPKYGSVDGVDVFHFFKWEPERVINNTP